MSVIQIVRYPNRRFYARQEAKYVSLGDIEQWVRSGTNVEIRDSQTDEDLTRAVLTRIIIERHPDKMALFPVDMLHLILRSNELMSHFLRDYFRHSLTYLEYLQAHTPTSALAQPMHWVKAWLDGIVPARSASHSGDPRSAAAALAAVVPTPSGRSNNGDAPSLAARVAELEDRIRQLEASGSETRPMGARGASDAGNH